MLQCPINVLSIFLSDDLFQDLKVVGEKTLRWMAGEKIPLESESLYFAQLRPKRQ